jgi:GNAT superfamily N-acetyltransferase
MARKPDRSRIELKPLARSDWPAVEKLFGPNGANGGCWCMWWRRKGGKSWQACKGEPNRADFRALVESGAAHGILAHAQGEPVGWCNIGPGADFPSIVHSRVLQRTSGARRWSVACFYIRPAWRRRGVAQLLLDAAVAEAFRRGAEEVEGYPKAYASAATAPAPSCGPACRACSSRLASSPCRPRARNALSMSSAGLSEPRPAAFPCHVCGFAA